MELFIQENPWRGLSSYKEGETIYGRDDDIRDLSQCVLRDKYTLLYGKSGIGKSSILNAAIIPALRRHGYIPVVIRLSHKDLDYLQQIHKAIVDVLGEDGVSEVFPPQSDVETLYEYMHRHVFCEKDGKRVKLYLLFDQFEEIFTLQSDTGRKKEFFRQLGDLCNDIKPNYLQPSATRNKPSNPVADLEDFDFDLPDLNSVDCVEDNDIGMIFTIREDFLSEFDYYVSSTPALRRNRYYLRPINEEQAAQIIMRPSPGLVNEQDAWLIISKVTKRTDFQLDGKPELIVDTAVLSLYLSKLYEARKEDGPITTDLIETKGGEIIYNFYKDAISTVSPETVKYLEDNLLTGQGRRDNITEYDAKVEGHVTEEELRILIDEKKILRRFNYAGEMRIEYIHDTLCSVAIQHIKERKEREQKEVEEKKMAALKKRNRLLLALLAMILLGGGTLLIFKVAQQKRGLPESATIPIVFQEDESVNAAKLYWRANLLIIGETPQGPDTIKNMAINDIIKDSTVSFVLNDYIKKVNIKLTFGKGHFVDVDTLFSAQELRDNPFVLLTIHKNPPQFYRYNGKVVTMIDGCEIPLQNAVVIVRDKVVFAKDGNFVIQLENQINDNDLIYIVKEGFSVFEKNAKELLRGDDPMETCCLKLDDMQTANFETQCNEIDSLLYDNNTKWEYWKGMFKDNEGFKFFPVDSTKADDALVMVARSLGQIDSVRRKIQGVYYYKSEYRKFKAMNHPHYAYHIFTGYMDKGNLNKKTLPEKHFEIESVNFVNNRQTILGEYDYQGYAHGEVRDASGVVGKFLR